MTGTGMRVTDWPRIARNCPFIGPRVPSNYWTFLALTDKAGGEIDGEQIEAAWRAGYLVASPAQRVHHIDGFSAKETGDIPDIEMAFRFDITPLGRSVISGS